MPATLTPDDALTLRAGGLEAALWPSLGGRVATLSGDGVDWLKPIPHDLPLQRALISGGCYPMAPYCGRIENARFAFRGQERRLPPHPISAPHSLHGVAWDRPFAAERLSQSQARMTLEHTADAAWPWSFRLEQTVRLTPAALTIDLTLINVDSAPQPAGLGLHPFFPRDAATRLRFACEGWWRLGPTMTPVALESLPAALDFSAGRPVNEGFDDVFTGFGHDAELLWADRRIAMRASPSLGTAVLYSPSGRGFFCFEPISHAPNAHNRDGLPDLTVLAPGEDLAAQMQLIFLHESER